MEKVIDFEKNEGWIHKSLIKADRFGIINTSYSEEVQIYKKPEGADVGKIGKRNVVKINKCIKKWCLIEIKKNKGWILKKIFGEFMKMKRLIYPFTKQLLINIGNFINRA